MTTPHRPFLPLWAALPLAALSGPIMDAGFPDRGWWPLSFLGIALVLLSLIGRRPAAAILTGFVAGLAFYLLHIQWASLFLGLLPMTALSVLESLFFAAGALLISRVYRWGAGFGRAGRRAGWFRLGLLPLGIAGLWTLREAIASTWPYGGFAWGRISLSQSQSPFNDLFAWLGVSGAGFVMVLLVALVIEAVRMRGASRLLRIAVPVGTIALVLAVPAFPIALSGTTTVAAVQGNGRAAYFDSREPGDLLAAQISATAPLFGEDVDMVVWPEGASDLNPLVSPYAARAFDAVSERMGAPLIAGTITERDGKYFNTSMLWRAGEGVVDFYDKKHPIPFGEYVPDRAFWRPFAPELIDLIGREYTPGTTDTVFDVNGVLAGIDICFDISDDTVMGDSVRSGAQLLIAQTNNADFGRTDESLQQLAIARIRALELGRSIVNISTVGTSAIIAPDGSTMDQLESYTASTMVEAVPLSSTITPAAQLGRFLEALFSAIGLAVLIAALLQHRLHDRRHHGRHPRRSAHL